MIVKKVMVVKKVMITENVEAQPQMQEGIQLDKSSAITQVLEKASKRGVLVKGIGEVCKALEAQKVKIIFLASDCDNDDYKNIIKALANQMKVPVVEVDKWEFLKDACHLGLTSEKIRKAAADKGKGEGKIKPRCSSCAILDWGEETNAKKFLEEFIKKEKDN